MKAGAPKPRFLVDEKGKKSSVLLSMADYRKLMEAWEEVADAEDFAEARATATKYIEILENDRIVRVFKAGHRRQIYR